LRLTVLLLLVATLGLGAATAATAGTIHDPADVGGRLDIRTVSFAQRGATLRYTVTMAKPWVTSFLGDKTQARAEVCILIWEKSPLSRIYDFSVCLKRQAGGHVSANVFENGHEELPSLQGPAVAIRPSSTAVTISFAKRLIDSPSTFIWRVRTFDRRFDYAPSQGGVTQRLR
jgi:hypothetical protein